jgi:hypothetical protein
MRGRDATCYPTMESGGIEVTTLTVHLSSELVEDLRALAGRRGQDLDSTVASLLKEQLHRVGATPAAPALSLRESELLQQIQEGLPEATWQRFHDLEAKLEAEQLTPDEQRELIDLADQIEGWSVRRLELAQQLADCRGVPSRQVVEELGLMAASHG